MSICNIWLAYIHVNIQVSIYIHIDQPIFVCNLPFYLYYVRSSWHHTPHPSKKSQFPLLSWAQKTAQSPRSAPAMKWFLSLLPLVLVPTSSLKLDPQGLGLPVASNRPGWLARRDELVVDARVKQRGGMLILQLVLNDAYGYWGSEGSTARPRWLRAILATNRKHAMQHGHAMVLRWKRTLPLTEWQEEMCSQKGQSREECAKSWERENFCWEKFPFMVPWNAAKSWRLCSVVLTPLSCGNTWSQNGDTLRVLEPLDLCPSLKLGSDCAAREPRWTTCWTRRSSLTWSCWMPMLPWSDTRHRCGPYIYIYIYMYIYSCFPSSFHELTNFSVALNHPAPLLFWYCFDKCFAFWRSTSWVASRSRCSSRTWMSSWPTRSAAVAQWDCGAGLWIWRNQSQIGR